MNDLIRREDVIQALVDCYDIKGYAYMSLMKAIEEIPAVNKENKMNDTYKEVYFNEWCFKCKYKETPETDDPCDNCLTERKREFSHKPAKFKEKE